MMMSFLVCLFLKKVLSTIKYIIKNLSALIWKYIFNMHIFKENLIKIYWKCKKKIFFKESHLKIIFTNWWCMKIKVSHKKMRIHNGYIICFMINNLLIRRSLLKKIDLKECSWGFHKDNQNRGWVNIICGPVSLKKNDCGPVFVNSYIFNLLLLSCILNIDSDS